MTQRRTITEAMKKLCRNIALGVWALCFLFALLVVLGPRPAISEVRELSALPENWMEIQSVDREMYPELRPDTEKMILWADPEAQSRTEYSIVFLHGFSTSRDEISPVVQRVASELGANVYFSRLPGHGIPGDAMGETVVDEWTVEGLLAWQIGEQVGEKVILLGKSTGATLATWVAFQDHLGVDPHALILVSPNYGPVDPRAEWAVLPWGKLWVPIIGGELRHRPAINDESLRIWTNPYPTISVIPMMALVMATKELPFSEADERTLFVYCPTDTVVNSQFTDEIYEDWPESLRERWLFELPEGRNRHNILGEIFAPEATDEAVDRFVRFIRGSVGAAR